MRAVGRSRAAPATGHGTVMSRTTKMVSAAAAERRAAGEATERGDFRLERGWGVFSGGSVRRETSMPRLAMLLSTLVLLTPLYAALPAHVTSAVRAQATA